LLKVTWLPDGVTKEVRSILFQLGLCRTMTDMRIGKCRGSGFSQRHCVRSPSCPAAKVGPR
jgi:hypothetical protein